MRRLQPGPCRRFHLRLLRRGRGRPPGGTDGRNPGGFWSGFICSLVRRSFSSVTWLRRIGQRGLRIIWLGDQRRQILRTRCGRRRMVLRVSRCSRIRLCTAFQFPHQVVPGVRMIGSIRLSAGPGVRAVHWLNGRSPRRACWLDCCCDWIVSIGLAPQVRRDANSGSHHRHHGQGHCGGHRHGTTSCSSQDTT